jgi:hypothetical protein
MNVLRAATGLVAIFASGCLIGFDADRLTGGGDAGSGGGAHGTPDAPAADMATAPANCDDLMNYMAGSQLTNWVDGRGTWRVAVMAQGKALIQTTGSTSRNDRFVAWRGAHDVADTTVRAVAVLDGNPTDLNCVLVRVLDASNYYALCVEDVGGRNRPETHQWSVYSVVAGTQTRLGGAAIPTAASHSLSLTAQGAMLLSTVDGDAKPAVTDTALTHGFVGVATDDGGGFSSLCTGDQ